MDCSDRLDTTTGPSRNSDEKEMTDVFSNLSCERGLFSPDSKL